MRALLVALALLAVGCAAPLSHLTNVDVHLVYVDRPEDTALTSRWGKLLATGVLNRLNEYGVVSGHVGSSDVVTWGLPQGSLLADGSIPLRLNSSFQAATVAPPTTDDVYVVLLPLGITTGLLDAQHANGYHMSSLYGATKYAFAPVQFFANEDIVISHEIYEASVNPWGLNGREVGDPCEGKYLSFDGVDVQQLWSTAQQKCW